MLKTLSKGTLSSTAVIIYASLFSTQIHASGFQISETSVSGLGRAFAGNGVAGDSISDMFANPAALSMYSGSRIELGAHILDINASFENQGSTTAIAGVGALPSSGIDSDGGGTSVVPNFFYSQTLSDTLSFGLGVTSPFGLATKYDKNWVGRYAAIKSELITVEVNPAMSYQLSEQLSLGAGISIIQADVELTRAQFLGAGLPDGHVRIEGDDTAVGWNLGALYDLGDTRLGVGYRAAVDVKPEGSLSITPLGINAGAQSKVTLPETAYLSAAHAVTEKLELLGGIRWTGWSSFEELRIQFDNGLPDNVTPENWDDTFTYNVGFNYHVSDSLTYRAGLAYDESPVSDEFRTARIPDTDRTWLSLGAGLQSSESLKFDFAYARLFTGSETINESTDLVASAPGAVQQNLRGQYSDSDVNILSASLTYHF